MRNNQKLDHQNHNKLKNAINKFCSKLLPSIIGENNRRESIVIHDATWGTNSFQKHEIDIINTPLFQRLRNIKQMGFVDYIYPSAKHSRFEHSLGVTIIASNMIDAVLRKEENEGLLDVNIKNSVRLSALLHDVGHCLYSHTSELVYGPYLEGSMDIEFKDDYKRPSAHEFLSYLVVTSKSFRDYFNKLEDEYRLNLDLDEIALRIVGRVRDEKNRYIVDFINGPIDADKLDYFHRDSQFSGIPIQLDIDRLYHEINATNVSKINADKVKINSRQLTVGKSGITCIEQIVFNKMVLYSTIYTHHTVEALDCMFKGVFEYIIKKEIKLNIDGKKRKIKTPADFLHLTEADLFILGNLTNDSELKRLIDNIQKRKLLKRAFIINKRSMSNDVDSFAFNDNIVDELKGILDRDAFNAEDKVDLLRRKIEERTEKHKGMSGMIKLLEQGGSKLEKHEYLRLLTLEIYNKAAKMNSSVFGEGKCTPYEVWIDIPKAPSSKEIQNIQVRGKKKNECNSIDYFFPFAQYEDLYENNRLNGYVFAPMDCVEYVSKAAKEVLEEHLKVEFNEASSVN